MCITSIWRSSERFYDLIEVSSWAIMQSQDDRWRNWHMACISKMSFTSSILYIHYAHKPRFCSNGVMIYTSFHADKKVCLWAKTTYFLSSIFCSFSELEKCQWHLRNSWSHFETCDVDFMPLKIRTYTESISESICFRSICCTKGKKHNYPISKQIMAAIPRITPVTSILERTSPNFQWLIARYVPRFTISMMSEAMAIFLKR